jgi:guanylate kinase
VITKGQKRGLLFIVSGPSGSGKTTLVKKLLAKRSLGHKLTRSISLTTRPRRSGEQDKEDYFFIGAKQFRQAQRAKKILEWTKYLGYYYATPRDFIAERIKRGQNIILCLDVKGALALKRRYPRDTVTIFISPPSEEALSERIAQRCRKTKDEEIKQRLKLAQGELEAAGRYDYCLVNQDLDAAVRQLRGIILKEIRY